MSSTVPERQGARLAWHHNSTARRHTLSLLVFSVEYIVINDSEIPTTRVAVWHMAINYMRLLQM